MELDENFKQLIKELGEAINASLSESDRIADVLKHIRAAGYDLFLVLEVTIGFNRRGSTSLVHRQKPTPEPREEKEIDFHLTNQDAQFLKALKISIQNEEE